MTRTVILTLLLAAAIVSARPVLGQELETMDAVGNRLMDCWSPPEGSDGSAVTLRFSFRRDGTLIGPPRPTNIEVEGDKNDRDAFVEAAVTSLRDCGPLTFADALARGIGGRVFLMTFRGGDEAATRADQ